jgi:hypothetical protein
MIQRTVSTPGIVLSFSTLAKPRMVLVLVLDIPFTPIYAQPHMTEQGSGKGRWAVGEVVQAP